MAIIGAFYMHLMVLKPVVRCKRVTDFSQLEHLVMIPKTHKQFVKNYVILDCAIAKREKIAFILKEEPEDELDERTLEELPTRILSYAHDLIGNNEGFALATEWKEGVARICLAFNKYENQLIAIDDDFCSLESKTAFEFHEIENCDRFCKTCKAIAHIGQHTYICGRKRKVFKRVGVKTWKDLTIPNEHPYMFKELDQFLAKRGNLLGTYTGFHAIDGFADDDIYAGGDRGDMWHFAGNRWTQIDLPANFDIQAITCAGDGWVYASGYTGGILKGREDHWKLLDAEPGLTIKASTWFNECLFLSDDYRLWFLDGDIPKPYDFPKDGPIQYSARGVKSTPDVLVAYGLYQVLAFDGQSWTEIIANPLIGQS